MAADLIDRVAQDLAAGRDVDWDAAYAAADHTAEREQLESLRLVHQIARAHRVIAESTGVDDAHTTVAAPSPTESAPDPAREVWGRYRLVQEVGSGTFGRVFKATDTALNLDVAIKILHRHVDDELLKERLLNEGRTLARVRHDNVVRVLGVEFNGNRVGLCTEFIRGETLEQEVRARGTFSQAQAVEVGSAICRALSAVHRAGFLHRDVKARNSMRERDTGRIVLMDFGTGRDLHDELASNGVGMAGTGIYMAPEVLLGAPASFSSDTYSVGVVLYHVLTGAYPVEGNSLAALKEAHRDGLRTPLGVRRPDLPSSFVRIVEQALAPKSERYATPAALGDALEKASADRGRLIKRLKVFAVTAPSVVGAFTALGFISTTYFNYALGRLDFVDEGFRDWLKWGAKSTLGPIIIAAIALVGGIVVLESIRSLIRMSAKSQDIERAIASFIHRRSLDDVRVVSALALMLSALLLVGAWWYFASLIETFAIYPDISMVSLDRIRLFSPDYAEFQWSYRRVFSSVLTASLMLWYPAVRLAIRTRRPIPRHVAVAGAIVLAMSIILLDFPYKLLTHDIDFQDVRWSGHTCQLLAQRGEDRLIFCSDLPAPRSRTVRSDSLIVVSEPLDPDKVVWDIIDAKRKRSIFKFLM
jgi:serine/threonine protein kinase